MVTESREMAKLKGVTNLNSDEKAKKIVPYGGTIFCLKKTEIVREIARDKRGATLFSYSDLIFLAIKMGDDIL